MIEDKSNAEWQDAFRIARIMTRQAVEMTCKKNPYTRPIPKTEPRKTKMNRESVEAVPTGKPKIFPFVSKFRWRQQRHIDAYLREFIFQRDGGRCFYCYCDVSFSGAHLDHVFPVSRGGKSTYANLVLSCAKCNLSKNASVLENLIEILAEVQRRNREVFG